MSSSGAVQKCYRLIHNLYHLALTSVNQQMTLPLKSAVCSVPVRLSTEGQLFYLVYTRRYGDVGRAQKQMKIATAFPS